MPLSHIAVIADVHANIWALDAVLQDARRRGIETIINLGDSLYGPLAPVETAKRLLREGLLSIQGNEDRILYDPSVPSSPTIRWVRNRISKDHLVWLRSLPTTVILEHDLFACHGTPQSDETYLLEEPSASGSVSHRPGALTSSSECCPSDAFSVHIATFPEPSCYRMDD